MFCFQNYCWVVVVVVVLEGSFALPLMKHNSDCSFASVQKVFFRLSLSQTLSLMSWCLAKVLKTDKYICYCCMFWQYYYGYPTNVFWILNLWSERKTSYHWDILKGLFQCMFRHNIHKAFILSFTLLLPNVTGSSNLVHMYRVIFLFFDNRSWKCRLSFQMI